MKSPKPIIGERRGGEPQHEREHYIGVLATGMCRNELLALHWQDVDLDAASLTVNLSLEYIRKHGLRFKAPKTKRGRRTITLPSHITHPGFCGSKDGSSRVPCPTIGVGTL